jgi:hypothetical protein
MMNRFTRSNRTFPRKGVLTALPLAALVALAGCDSSTDLDNGHSDFSRVEIQTRGQASAMLAVWTSANGWQSPTGGAITELPNPRDEEGVGLIPLRAGGPHASLTVRFFDNDGDQIQIATASRDADPPRERTCTEDEARFVPVNPNTNVIAWPNIRNPASPNGPFHWAQRSDGSIVGMFHCDHLYLIPENAGTVDIEFHLWHIDHSDGKTDPIRVRVEPAN